MHAGSVMGSRETSVQGCVPTVGNDLAHPAGPHEAQQALTRVLQSAHCCGVTAIAAALDTFAAFWMAAAVEDTRVRTARGSME